MTVRIEGLNHVIPIQDPVPFFGGLVATVMGCRGETHDDTPVEVFVKVCGVKRSGVRGKVGKKKKKKKNLTLFDLGQGG